MGRKSVRQDSRVTLKDVARAAGVTPATVSNVVRGAAPVAEATRQSVEKMIRKLGYRPNLVARGLVNRRTDTIGLVLPDISNPFYPEIALEVESLASKEAQQVLLCNSEHDPHRSAGYLEKFYGGIVDGVIVLEGGVEPVDVINLANQGVPVVACLFADRLADFSHPLVATVDIDFYLSGRLAAQHLVSKGHRTFGVILNASRDGKGGHHPRLRGFEDELRQHGFGVEDRHLEFSTTSIESGRQALLSMLQNGPLPSAIFTGNDLLAIGASGAAVDKGLSIPEDVSFLGVDNIQLASHVRPGLTSIDVHKQRLAREAFGLLSHLTSSQRKPTNVLIEPSLVERDSVLQRN